MAAVWSLAGHDPMAAAGVAADLRVGLHRGVPMRPIIACFTAQNHSRMTLCEAVPASWLRAQWDALCEAETPAVIKLGLLREVATVQLVGQLLRELPQVPVICDPVLATSSGFAQADAALRDAYREFIFPRVSLLTPNRPEAEQLLGRALTSMDEVQAAARELRSWGLQAVLIKGGHSDGRQVEDYFDGEGRPFSLQSERKAGRFRGTGCSLSAAIACEMARGLSLREAVVKAHAEVQAALASSSGTEPRTLDFKPGPTPLSRLSYDGYFPELGFPPVDALGFYPVVPHLDWLKRLLPTGVRTIQLRLKDLSRSACARQIAEASALCRGADVRLFVNDYWELAREAGAYGVHLGQEDLDSMSPGQLRELRQSGLRLGISTHCYEEAARALNLRPSYIALGPIFATSCKSMQFGPQGIERLREWKMLCPQVPLVAIGGLRCEHAAALLAAGADGIAVVSDVLQHERPELRTRDWLRLINENTSV